MKYFCYIFLLFFVFSNTNAFSQESSLGNQSIGVQESYSNEYSNQEDSSIGVDGYYNFDYSSSFGSWESSFDNFMIDFEVNLNLQMEQMNQQIDNMMFGIISEVDLYLQDTFNLVNNLSNKLPSKVTNLLDTRLESYFNLLDTKFDSKTQISKLEKLERAIDKNLSKSKIKDSQTKDLLNYMGALTQIEKGEIVKEEAQTIIDSKEDLSKEDLSDIKSLFEQLNIQQ